MIKINEYKRRNEMKQLNSECLKLISEPESNESEFLFFQQIFSDLTTEFKENRIQAFIEIISNLNKEIFDNQERFDIFNMKSSDSLLFFLQQCSDFLDFINDKDKEAIVFYFNEMILNMSFANSFSNFKGDLMLIDLYQSISNNVDKYILNILSNMKISPEFPITIFKDYFNDHPNYFDFLILFNNCMDKSEDINSLFQEFILFPPPQKKSFSLFCQTIINFFQHSLDLDIFVESNYYDNIDSLIQSDLFDQDISYYLQITARLVNYDEILSKTHPDFLFLYLKIKKNKSIVVPIMIIIYHLIEREIFENSSSFIDEYFDESIILILLENLQNDIFAIRIKSIFLLNSIIVKSNYHIFQLLLKCQCFDQVSDFINEISQIIHDFLSSDIEELVVSSLQLAYHVFIYFQKPENSELILQLLNIWKENGIYYIIEEFVTYEDNVAEQAQILYQKITALNNFIEG